MTHKDTPEGFTYLYDYDDCPYFYKKLTEEVGVIASHRDKDYNGDSPFYIADIAKCDIQKEWDIDYCLTKAPYYFHYEEGERPKEIETFDFSNIVKLATNQYSV